MSVNFSPAFDPKKKIPPEKMVWTASWMVKKWPLPKWLPQKNLDEIFYNKGQQTLDYWANLAQSFGLNLVEDFPWRKTWVDQLDDCHLVMAAYGEEKDKIGKELDISNMNADHLCQFLGIPETGRSNPIAFLKKIENAKLTKRLTEYGRAYNDSKDEDPFNMEGKARMIDMGLDENKIYSYLNRLEDICDYCIKTECDIAWG